MDHKSRKPRSSSSDALIRLFQLRLAAESTRADDAEQQVTHLFARIRIIHKEKLDLQAELYKTRQELQLWQIQLEAARKEISRAQETIDRVERARLNAEARADRNRQRVRRLLQEQAVQNAIDEGRRLGFQQGLDFGRRRLPRLPPVSHPRTADSRQGPRFDPVVSSSIAPHSLPNIAVDPARSSSYLSANVSRPNHFKGKKTERAPIQSGFSAPPDYYMPNVKQTNLPYKANDDANTTAELVSPNDAHPASQQSISPAFHSGEPACPSPLSSTLSDLEIISPPRDIEADQQWARGRTGSPSQSQSERIAERWKSQRDDILITAPAFRRKEATSTNSHHSSTPEHTQVNLPPVAPRPAPSRPITTIKNARKPNDAVPIQVSDIFYEPSMHQQEQPMPAIGSPKEWLRSKFRERRKDSDMSVPGIDIQPPSRSSTNTEGASFDPFLLTPGHLSRPISTSVASSRRSDSPVSPEHEEREPPIIPIVEHSSNPNETISWPSQDPALPVDRGGDSKKMFSPVPGSMAFTQNLPHQTTLHQHAYPPPIMPFSDIMVMRVGIPQPARSPSPHSQSWTPATLHRPFSIFSDC